MNDIAKKSASDRFLNALEKEGLAKAAGGRCIDIEPAQVSYLFNEKYWNRLGQVGWDKILRWVNSGQSLGEYSKKHGRVIPEQQKTEPEEKKHPEIQTQEPTISLSHYKEVTEKQDREIHRLMGENSQLIKELNNISILETDTDLSKKIPIDIEIELIVCGRKIRI